MVMEIFKNNQQELTFGRAQGCSSCNCTQIAVIKLCYFIQGLERKKISEILQSGFLINQNFPRFSPSVKQVEEKCDRKV